MSDSGLLPGWAAYKTKDGRPYYHNAGTNQTTWVKPRAVQAPVHHNAPDPSKLLEQISADNGPCSVYSAWQKSGSQEARLVQEFESQVGTDAAETLAFLQKRHAPIDVTKFSPNQTFTSVWEETWSAVKAGTRDELGEGLIMKLGVILRARNMKFSDPYFPPAKEVLFVDPSEANKNKDKKPTGRSDEDPFLCGKDIDATVSFKRAAEIGNPREKAVVFNGSISPDDVAQGDLGNCYYIAALAACAASENDMLINDLIVEDCADVGLFGIKFFFMGKWITVAVDDHFPCTLDRSNQWVPVCARPKKHSDQEIHDVKEIWPLLFEKAFAKLHKSYECTDAGMSQDALQYLTGGLVSSMNLSGKLEEFERLLNAFQEGKDIFVSATIRGKADGFTPASLKAVGLYSGHAYSLLRAVRTSSGVQLVQVRNPWGRCEWIGRYSDRSPEMTPALKEELKADAEEDGSFFMPFDDFCKYYKKCNIVDPTCFNRLSEDSRARVDGAAGAWVAGMTAGGKLGSPCFDYNPKFQITGFGGEVWITVYQPDVRHTAIAPIEAERGQPFMAITSYLGPVGSQLQEVKDLYLYGGFDGDRFMSYRATLQAGVTYQFVATASSPGMEGAFSFTACGKGVQIKACPVQAPPPQIAAAMARRESRPRK